MAEIQGSTAAMLLRAIPTWGDNYPLFIVQGQYFGWALPFYMDILPIACD